MNDKTIAFIHNPKTGGRYIRRKLKESCDRQGNIRILRYRGIRMFLGHLNARDARVFLKDYPRHTLVSVIRNPYNRAVSIFNEQVWMNEKMGDLYKSCGEDIKAFWQAIAAMPQEEQDRLLRSPEVPWYNPQSWWMGDDITSYRYELTSNWTQLAAMLGIDISDLNIKADYPVDEELLAILKQLYPEDGELFKLYGL